jgi:hypothetical protein
LNKNCSWNWYILKHNITNTNIVYQKCEIKLNIFIEWHLCLCDILSVHSFISRTLSVWYPIFLHNPKHNFKQIFVYLILFTYNKIFNFVSHFWYTIFVFVMLFQNVSISAAILIQLNKCHSIAYQIQAKP